MLEKWFVGRYLYPARSRARPLMAVPRVAVHVNCSLMELRFQQCDFMQLVRVHS